MPAGLTALAATYVSSTQYTLTGDQTTIHEQYRPVLMVKNDESVVGDCYVVSSAYAGGVTTVTISGAVVPATIVSGSIGDLSIPGNNSALPIAYLNTQYLNRTNVGVFVPSADYEPATKKYVDDNAGVTDIEMTTISGDLVGQIVTDHGALTGLADDDHTIYLLADGTRGLSADWDAGAHKITAADIDISTMTSGSVLFIGGSGEIKENNSALYFEKDNGYGKLAVGDSAVMRNTLQAVHEDSITNMDNVKALISVRNKNITNNNCAGFTAQTLDTSGNVHSGARLMTKFTSHAENAVSADLIFDTRNAGSRTEKMRIKADGKVGIGTDNPGKQLEVNGTVSGTYFYGDGSNLTNIDKYTQVEVDNFDYATNTQLTTTSGDIVTQIPTDYITDAEMTTISGDLQTNIDAKMSDLSDDTTPQLGGDLDANTHAIVAADHTTVSGVDQVVNTCYGTGEAPVANTTTIGTIYIKYTA